MRKELKQHKIGENVDDVRHLPDHSSQKGKTSWHDHIFSHVYLLLGGRSVLLCTLLSNHFCLLGSEISSSISEEKKLMLFEFLKQNKSINLIYNLQEGSPSCNIRLWQENLTDKNKKQCEIQMHVICIHDYDSREWNADNFKHLSSELLTLCCCLNRSLIFPHCPSPRRGGSPNEPSPQLYKEHKNIIYKSIHNDLMWRSTPESK